MIQSIGEIIKDTNEIADSIYHNAQRYGKSISVTAGHELRIASIDAAAKIMQAKIIAKVIDDKAFR